MDIDNEVRMDIHNNRINLLYSPRTNKDNYSMGTC